MDSLSSEMNSLTPEMNKCLVAAVKNYSELYDRSREEYGRRNLQTPIWQKVADTVGITVDQAKKSWNMLRTSFRRSLASNEDSNTESSKEPWYLQDRAIRQQWYLTDEMEFLVPFLRTKEYISDENPEEDSDNVDPVNYLEIVQNSTSPDAKKTEELNRNLITAIKNYPELYDNTRDEYGLHNDHNQLWQNVADTVGISVDQAKRSWHNLRTSFAQSLGANSRPSYLQEEMEFLLPFIPEKHFMLEENTIEETESANPSNTIDSDDNSTSAETKKMEEINKKLVAVIKGYPELYDRSREEYGRRNVQNELWQKVAESVGVPVDQAKKTWHGLRNSFNRSLASYYDSSKRPSRHTWYLKKEMSFLLPFIKKQKDFNADKKTDENLNSGNPMNFLEIMPNSTSPVVNSSSIKSAQGNVGIIFVPGPSPSHSTDSGLHLEDNPELSFFYSALPDIKKLNESNKRKLKSMFMNNLHSLLNEQQGN